MSSGSTKFWGKYRGRVTDNADPFKLGRLKLTVPDVLGPNESGWALPAFAYAATGRAPGSSVGLFLVPPADAWVWVEFEHGDSERPIWTGCFFPDDPAAALATAAALAPLAGVDPGKQVLKAGQWVITIDGDTLTFEHLLIAAPRKRLALSGTELKLTNEPTPGAQAPICATVELSANKTAINGTALEVT